ncbi:MAG: hypothetical protein KDJ18_05960 [Hyphomicrobiaceae bacterium]|nr:hypothetical protein [Hyphomicrobiaceae bacterium]
MGMILDFNEHAARMLGRSSRGELAGSAEIVIFPGVRYERWEDGEDADAAAPVMQRDRIELPD